MTAELDLDRLARLLVDSGVEVRGPLHAAPLTGGRSNLTFKVTDGNAAWVARRPPLSGLTSSAHDMLREYTVVEALSKTEVPVAPAVACDSDGSATGSPLCVVGFVPGLTVRDRLDLDALTDDQVTVTVRSLIDTLVALHAVDYHEIGLTSFGRPAGFVQRQAAVWTRQWNHVKTRDLPDVDRLADALLSRPAPNRAATIVHGDFRIDNTLLHPDRNDSVAAVVDWEMSTLGDPLTDVALMCAYRSPSFDHVLGTPAAWTSPRLPDADTIAQWYATASRRDLGDWNHYVALAHLKVAVIAEGIAYRGLRHAYGSQESIGAAKAVPEFAAAGLRALS